MQINTSLTALGNLLAIILAKNTRFPATTEDQLTLVSVASQDADADGRNAVATVSVEGYPDNYPFTFKQLGFADATGQSSFGVSVTTGASDSDVLAAIASAYGLVASELVLSYAADAGENPAVATVDAASGSLLYLAGPISVALTWVAPVVTLASLVDNAALDGFDAVASAAVPAADGSTSTATDGTTPAADGAAAADGSTTGTADGAASDGAATGTAAADGTGAAADGAAAAADGSAAAADGSQATAS